MPNETVQVTISGANGPQTKSVAVAVNPSTGNGSATVSWTGSSFGVDSIGGTATIQGANYTSNIAQTRWGVNDITDTVASGSGFNSNTFYTFVVVGVFPDGTHTGKSKSATSSFTHFFLQWTPVVGVSFYNVYCTQSVQGSAGALTATVGLLHGIGSGNSGNNSSTIGGGGPNFPPSITQLWMDDGSFFPYSGNGAAPPATNTTLLPPSLASPTGHLTITPAGSALVVGTVNSLTVSLSGIVYTSVPYIPLFQGVSGALPLYNNPSSNVFTYQMYNGQPVNKSAAVTNAWTGSGDNTFWQGRAFLDYDGTNIRLNYNGTAPASGVDTTTLTITAEDIAWFNAPTTTFDVFSGSGGTSLSVLVEWLVRPTVASVTPTTAQANGTSQNFSVTLSSPVSPRQLGTQFSTGNSLSANSFTLTNATVTNVAPAFNGSGWLTGWTVTATIPSSTSNSTATMSANVTGVLTYLSGSTFVTAGAVTYINGAIATINLTGASFNPPQAYSFSVFPAGPTYTTAQTLTLTGIVFQQQNNPVTMAFIGVNKSTSAQFAIGAGTQTSRITGTFGGNSGWITTFTRTYVSSGLPASPGATLGFTATDSTSGLTVTFLTSTAYVYAPISGGGGGGGGCPAAEMFLDHSHRVCDTVAGFSVDTLKGETEGYLTGLPDTEMAEIVQMDYDMQPCYRLTADNGAEVVVSDSTPVPTREAIQSSADGMERSEIKIYASEIQAGMHVIANIGKGPEWAELVEVVDVGMRRVCRLYCGGRNFAAGTQPGKYIYTHNLLNIVK
jgi:hypothetical protein